MKLKAYLELNGFTNAAFGQMIKTSSEAVRRYASGERIPHVEVMRSIISVTKSKVMPNDFY
jgi:hypothetical protein